MYEATNIPKDMGTGPKRYCSHVSQAPTIRAWVVAKSQKKNVIVIINLIDGEKYFCRLIKLTMTLVKRNDSINSSVAKTLDLI